MIFSQHMVLLHQTRVPTSSSSCDPKYKVIHICCVPLYFRNWWTLILMVITLLYLAYVHLCNTFIGNPSVRRGYRKRNSKKDSNQVVHVLLLWNTTVLFVQQLSFWIMHGFVLPRKCCISEELVVGRDLCNPMQFTVTWLCTVCASVVRVRHLWLLQPWA